MNIILKQLLNVEEKLLTSSRQDDTRQNINII